MESIQIAGGEFESLEAMMRAHAESAVRMAAEENGLTLDYSPESIARLETAVAARMPVPEAELEKATLVWGAYFGEVFRRRSAAAWIMAEYPGRQVAMPALDIGGSHVYPLLKVYRRLTLGPGEDLVGFYEKVAAAVKARAGEE